MFVLTDHLSRAFLIQKCAVSTPEQMESRDLDPLDTPCSTFQLTCDFYTGKETISHNGKNNWVLEKVENYPQGGHNVNYRKENAILRLS